MPPPWIESGAGGGSSAGVQSDGTSIAGIGTAGNKLRETSADFFASIGREDATLNPIANTVCLTGFVLERPLTFSSIWVDVRAHNSNPVDFGIYDHLGNLVADVGACALASNTVQALPVLNAPITLQPGRYLFAFTAEDNTLSITETTAQFCWAFDGGTQASALGQLPATITPVPILIRLIGANFCLS